MLKPSTVGMVGVVHDHTDCNHFNVSWKEQKKAFVIKTERIVKIMLFSSW